VFEVGRHPVETIEGEQKIKTVSGHAGIEKMKLVRANIVNVSDPETGKTEKLEILDVVSNPANADYNRRGVITKGTIVRTEKGLARIISRPGQTGSLSAVVHKE
jgi:small subunit ribosomal protein S8e